jgi:hypothetical protein
MLRRLDARTVSMVSRHQARETHPMGPDAREERERRDAEPRDRSCPFASWLAQRTLDSFWCQWERIQQEVARERDAIRTHDAERIARRE